MVGFFGTVLEGLTLYVRQSTWLNTALKKPKGDTSEEPAKSRMQTRLDADESYQPPLPEVAAPHLLGYLFEIGPISLGGAMQSPITSQEILAWQQLTRIALTPWEARAIKRMSIDYLDQMHASEAPDCKAPWMPADYVTDHSATAKSMQKALEGLLKL